MKSNTNQIQSHNDDSSSSHHSELNDIVEKILLNVESRQTSSTSTIIHRRSNKFIFNDDNNAKLSISELEQLSLLSSSTSSSSVISHHQNNSINQSSTESTKTVTISKTGWASVNIDSLCDLCKVLENHIHVALKVDYIKFAREAFDEYFEGKGKVGKDDHRESLDEWSDMTPRKNSSSLQLSTILRQGLQAASIILSIMVSPFVDRRIVSEDTILSAIKLMRFHISKNIIPCLSNTGHTVVHATTVPLDDKSTPEEKISSKKRRRKSTESITPETNKNKSYQKHLITFLKKSYKPLLSLTSGHLILLMEKIDCLIQTIQVDDQPLLSICSASLSTFTIDPTGNDHSQTHVLQSCAISLVTTVFRQYERHRIVILEDLFPLYLKLPTGKKSMRSYPVRCLPFLLQQQKCDGTVTNNYGRFISPMKQRNNNIVIDGDQQQKHIQVMTALILYLIQSCITIPIQNQSNNDNHENDDENKRSTILRSSSFSSNGLEQCELTCKRYTAFLLQRCAKKGDDGGASEFRPVLYNLIDDLLDVQLLPEYPAAEMLLMALCRSLTHDLLASSSMNKNVNSAGNTKRNNSNIEQTYLTTCMDALGTICSDIAFKLVAAKDNSLEFTKAISAEAVQCQDVVNPFTDSSEVNGCFCGREKSNVFSLDCDRCHRWFHGNCLRIAKDFTPTYWNCDECKMILLAKEQLGLKFDDEKDLGDEERVHIMRIVLLNFLTYQLRTSQALTTKDARQFHIARFVKDTEKVEQDDDQSPLVSFAQYLQMWNISQATFDEINSLTSSSSGMSHEYLSEAGNAKVMISLNAAKSELVANFPQLLGVLVALMGDEDVTHLRKGAVKAISQVVQADSSLMSKKMIRVAVSERFSDEAISVREAVVALVGVYVLQLPELAELFHNSLHERLFDIGVSVRKRVIKIFRDLIIANPTYRGRTAVLNTMLQQAANRKEDDGVRDLIHETFQILWFSARLTSMGETPKGPHETVKQMLDIVIIDPARSHVYLGSMLQEMLYGTGEGDKGKSETKKRQHNTQKYCSVLVSELFEELIRFEENRTSSDKKTAGPHLVALLSILRVFAESSPSLLLKHVDTLLPYLKADNSVSRESEAAIVFNVCKIFGQVSNHLSEGSIQKLGRSMLTQDLRKIIYGFDSKPTSAAVELLANFGSRSLSPNNPFTTELMKIAKIFYSLLYSKKGKISDFAKLTGQEKSNIQRAMSVIGSICRHYYSSKDGNPIEDIEGKLVIIDPSEINWSNLSYSSYAILEEYLDQNHMTIKCNALRALGGIFLSHPRVMLALEQQGILKELISEASHPDLQLETLKCFQAILCSEERRVESGEARRQMQSKEHITSSKQVSGDQDGDATLIGSCCTEHLARLFEMTSSCNVDIRANATRLIDTLSRQGLLNPMEVVPYLIALQGDLKHPQIRSLSKKLLKEIIETRPGMVRQSFEDGIKQCYFLQCKVYPDEKKVAAIVDCPTPSGKPIIECIFKDIFENAIGSSRVHSKKTIKSLLSLYSRQPQSGQKVESKKRIPFLSFITEILAHLPYNHLGDVVFILHSISETIALEAHETMHQLTTFLQSNGLDADPDSSIVDLVEKAASKKNPSRSNDLAAINKKHFDTVKFSELCCKGCSLSLLIRLYFYLRECFKGVTEKRLIEYDPSEKERINDRGAIKANTTVPLDSTIPNSFTRSGSIDKENLIRQYAIFRSSMRKYENSFLIQSEDKRVSDEENDDGEHERKRKQSVLETIEDNQ